MRAARAGVAATVVIGVVACLILAARAEMSTSDTLELAAIAAGVTLLGLFAGIGALHALNARSVAIQVSAVTVVTAGAIGAGAYLAAGRMFISEHDLTSLTVILVAAITAGVATAIVLGERVGNAVRLLGRAARELSLDSRSVIPTTHGAASELAILSAELQTMERRLRDATGRERVLEASRRELVASVSHDLRTPLAGMRAILEAFEDELIDDQATKERYLRTLHDEVRRLSALVDDLFELSRAEAGVLRLEVERVSLGDLVSDALAGSAPVAAAKGVHLVGTVRGDPPDVAVSPSEVLRVLRNILENAIRHTPSDGSVCVEVGTDHAVPPCAFVAVQDTGGGMAEHDLPHVFDVAFQSDPSRRPGGGAGLGLAIAKRLVEAHDGALTAQNVDGGARFTVRLPCAATSNSLR
jgi:signal transduction histidine kinase